MPLWIDKHKPKSLNELTIHGELTSRLSRLADTNDIPHLLFYGPTGAGKKTRINALLKEIFGSGVEKVKMERKSFKTPSNKTVELTALGSNYHLEMNPSEVGIYDRLVVQEVIKEIAASHVVLQPTTPNAGEGGATSSSSSSATRGKPNFKVVVINEADQLSRLAQAGLRRTMEKYVGNCRIILVCESLSKVIEPIRSRCLTIRVPAPTEDDIDKVISKIFKKEGVDASAVLISKVAKHSNRNLRRAILMSEAMRVQAGGSKINDDMNIQLPDWERYIAEMAKEIASKQTPQALLEIRAKLYELLANCIPSSLIFKTLTDELCRRIDDDMKFQTVHWAAFYEARLTSGGQKPIYHLEAFVAKFMSIYKAYLIDTFG